MIDEHRQDLAAEYALDALDPESTRAFEALLANDAELKALSDRLRAAAAALAHDAPPRLPPPELRERLLASIRGGSSVAPFLAAAPTALPAEPARRGVNIIPWALAAGFMITTAALWLERDQWRQETLGLRKEALELRNRDVLARMKIAMLSAQVDTYEKASAAIVWDQERQHGIVKMAKVPKAAAGTDYQLWVMDPKYPNPVSGGVLPVGEDGIARVVFHPAQPIRKAEKFAISVEPEGGVPKPTGPIVFLGN